MSLQGFYLGLNFCIVANVLSIILFNVLNFILDIIKFFVSCSESNLVILICSNQFLSLHIFVFACLLQLVLSLLMLGILLFVELTLLVQLIYLMLQLRDARLFFIILLLNVLCLTLFLLLEIMKFFNSLFVFVYVLFHSIDST